MSKVTFTLLASCVLFANVASAGVNEAEVLFDEAKCMRCHDNIGFKVKNSKVKDFSKLNASVEKCAYSTHVSWFDDENRDVSLFLNEKFYHYEAPAQDE